MPRLKVDSNFMFFCMIEKRVFSTFNLVWTLMISKISQFDFGVFFEYRNR